MKSASRCRRSQDCVAACKALGYGELHGMLVFMSRMWIYEQDVDPTAVILSLGFGADSV